MQKIILLTVGSLKSSWAKDASEEYVMRLQPTCKLEIIEIAASKEKDPEKQRRDESEKILKALSKIKGTIWLLDEKGERMTSQEFSFFLSQARDSGETLIFVLGGAYGLGKDLRSKARGSLRLSDMTLPHELCRVFFLEQLYRGSEIMKGSGYHH